MAAAAPARSQFVRVAGAGGRRCNLLTNIVALIGKRIRETPGIAGMPLATIV